jgi:competence protein ComEC
MIFCWLGFFLCGSFLAAQERAYLPSRHLELLDRRGLVELNQPVQVIGWARTSSMKRPGSETFDLEVTQIRQAGHSLPAQGAIRVYYFQNPSRTPSLDIAYGTLLGISFEDLRRPRNFLTPGSFDWQGYMGRQGMSFTGLVRSPEDVQVLPGRAGSWLLSAALGLRMRLFALVDRLYGGERGLSNEGAILRAMLLGDDNWLSRRTETVFQNSGTYHVLVVSGWNVVAMTLILFWLFRWARVPPSLATLFVAVAVGVFILLTGSDIPVLRAALMCVLYLIARLLYRERALLNSIAAAALILLVMHPSDLWDGGFQLSFFAVLVLAGVAVPIVERTATPYRLALRSLEDRERDRLLAPKQVQFRQDLRVLLDFLCTPSLRVARPGRWFRVGAGRAAYWFAWITEAFLLNLVMQIGFALLIALYFHRVAWSGVLANLLILPITGVLILVGLPLLLLSLAWWPLAQLGAVLLGWLVFALQEIASWAAQLSWLNRRVPPPPLWTSLCFFALLIVMAMLAPRRERWVWAPAAALIVLCVLITWAPYAPQIENGKLEVTVMDVGQGDSLFITFPQGTTMLVDAGGAIPIPGTPPPRMDIGESVVSSYLWSRGIQTLDYVVLTHDHWDHFGGLESIFENFRVGEFWIGPDPADRNMEWLRERAARAGARTVRTRAGTRLVIDGTEVLVLSPPADWAPRRVSNNDSVVLRLSFGSRHILLPGDVEARMERRLMGDGLPIASQVLKVAHHGSRTSTTPEFLNEVAPRFGIISVGAFGRFGHPYQSVIETLRSAGVRTYRTDQDGTVTISTDGNRIELTTFRETQRSWPRFVP